jgi:hypothetical protein
MKYNPKYQPHLPEEEEAYFHGQVYSVLRVKAAVNALRKDNIAPEDFLVHDFALFKIEEALKQALTELENET